MLDLLARLVVLRRPVLCVFRDIRCLNSFGGVYILSLGHIVVTAVGADILANEPKAVTRRHAMVMVLVR